MNGSLEVDRWEKSPYDEARNKLRYKDGSEKMK
jgi:hypothetical protein